MDVMSTQGEFESGSYCLEWIHKLHLFLLPKCHGALRVGNFLSLCLTQSTTYLQKILANR